MLKWLANKVWHQKVEGYTCMNGVNVYPAWDRSSSGFIIKLGRVSFKVRYAKRIQKWFVKLELVPKPSYTDYSI